MDELLAEFIAETCEMLDAISGEIVAWEANPQDRERLDSIFRFVHTVKGSSGFLDLPVLQKLSHEAETTLSDLRSGKRRPNGTLVSAILAIIDRIGEIACALEKDEEITSDHDDELIAQLSVDADDGADQTISTPQKTSSGVRQARTIRVTVELLDRLMNGVSDLVLSRNELSHRLRALGIDADTQLAFDRLSTCISEVRDTVSWTRMQRIEQLFAPLPRIVRDVSADLGKSVSLTIDGSDVELDREMIEMLRDPLVHIVRNALDHGIERPSVRRQAGKSPNGELTIIARQTGNRIEIKVGDDGCGLDPDKIMARAIAMEVVSPQAAADYDAAQTLDLIFHPGLSTAANVSEVSGRGVGMDVVRSNIQRIGGSIEIETDRDSGTGFLLSVPLTLTIIPALVVGLGDQRFAIPRPAIVEIVSLSKGSATIEAVGGTEVLSLRGRRMPIIRLSDTMNTEIQIENKLVVVRPARGERYALAISQAFDHEDLVIKPAAPIIAQAGIYAGTALPDSGRPILLLDVAGIADQAGLRLHAAKSDDSHSNTIRQKNQREMLIFDDLDGRRRMLTVGVLQRIVDIDYQDVIDVSGSYRIPLDDGMIPLTMMGPFPETGKLRVLCLTDGHQLLGYAILGSADVRCVSEELDAAKRPGPIAGAVMLEDGPVEVIDPHHLFSEYADDAVINVDRPTCLVLAGDGEWEGELLVPLIEQAGYVVYFGDGIDPEQADVVIDARSGETETPKPSDVTKIVKLGATANADKGQLGRYDRLGIYDALRARNSKRNTGT